jgi:hypothetical protein
MPKNAENAEKFICEKCNFICSKKSNFNSHLSTLKHQIRTSTKVPTNEKNAESKKHECPCGKSYMHSSSLWNHRKKCFAEYAVEILNKDRVENNIRPTQPVTTISSPIQPTTETGELTKIILELVRDNKDFKNMLIEQHKTMIELAQKPTITNTANSHNTNSNNKQFNLNFFLNEQCKNAINLNEFVENVKLGFNELENVADMGYVDGVTQIFMNGLKELDIYNRPLHCTDIKREIMHVRENNMWVKDTPDQAKIKSAIRRIAFRNIQQISEWNKQHPDSEILDTPDFDRSFQIMKQSLGDTCPGGVERNNDKIAKNIIKAVYVDKQSIVIPNNIEI